MVGCRSACHENAGDDQTDQGCNHTRFGLAICGRQQRPPTPEPLAARLEPHPGAKLLSLAASRLETPFISRHFPPSASPASQPVPARVSRLPRVVGRGQRVHPSTRRAGESTMASWLRLTAYHASCGRQKSLFVRQSRHSSSIAARRAPSALVSCQSEGFAWRIEECGPAPRGRPIEIGSEPGQEAGPRLAGSRHEMELIKRRELSGVSKWRFISPYLRPRDHPRTLQSRHRATCLHSSHRTADAPRKGSWCARWDRTVFDKRDTSALRGSLAVCRIMMSSRESTPRRIIHFVITRHGSCQAGCS